MVNAASYLRFATRLVDEAAAMLHDAPQTRFATQVKPDKTFVTSLDVAIEARLRSMIADEFPSHGVWGEEFETTQTDASFVWTLDPIDGTMALVSGIPVYSTLISLCVEGRPLLGVMHFPATNERWVGVQGQVTTLNGIACATSPIDALSNATMSASNPDFFSNANEKRALAAFTQCTAWRVFGAAAMAYGRLASGRTQLALDAGLKIYDYAPFVPIIEGAGGVISDWDGRPLHLHSGACVLAAANPALHAQALARLHAHREH